MRTPFQILAFPYMRNQNNDFEYAIFKRSDAKYWQGVAGGGEDNEMPLETATRETEEEIGSLPVKALPLVSMVTVPAKNILSHAKNIEKSNILMIPEYSFGVELKDKNLKISHEHTEYRWVKYEEAIELLKWDSNKSALWELNYRLTHNLEDISDNIVVLEKYKTQK